VRFDKVAIALSPQLVVIGFETEAGVVGVVGVVVSIVSVDM